MYNISILSFSSANALDACMLFGWANWSCCAGLGYCHVTMAISSCTFNSNVVDASNWNSSNPSSKGSKRCGCCSIAENIWVSNTSQFYDGMRASSTAAPHLNLLQTNIVVFRRTTMFHFMQFNFMQWKRNYFPHIKCYYFMIRLIKRTAYTRVTLLLSTRAYSMN